MLCEYLNCNKQVSDAERQNSAYVRRFCAKHRNLCNKEIAMLYNGEIDGFVKFWMEGTRLPVKASDLSHRNYGIVTWLLLKPLLLKIRMQVAAVRGGMG